VQSLTGEGSAVVFVLLSQNASINLYLLHKCREYCRIGTVSKRLRDLAGGAREELA